MFTKTDNSTSICSDIIKVDSGGDLNVYLASSNRWVNISNEIPVEEGGYIFERINTAIFSYNY
jgi:hypothetical protein